MKSVRRNNQGFSLTELIVVVAMLAILATASMSTLSQITAGRAKKVANEFTALMAECKVDAISGAQQLAYLKFEKVGDDIYGRLYEKTDKQVKSNLLGEKVKCEVLTSAGTDTIAIDGTNYLCIGFERGTGALKDMTNDNISGTLQEIRITGGMFTYTIEVHAATGYFKLK